MSQDGDDDDDLQLKSLRAVWLAMPDEDPPERGLDALMAAARTKASQMADGSTELPQATPSWWDKLVAVFRRPAALAFATVVVLIAGAVLFGTRGTKATAPTSGASPSNEDVPTQRRERESLKQEAPPPPAKDGDATPRLAAPHAPDGVAPGGGAKASVQAPHHGKDAVEGDSRPESAAVDQSANERAKQKLLDEAKATAARGDCANTRIVARQLEQQDLGYYRTRVVPDPDIANCLLDRKAAGAVDNAGRAATTPTE